MVDIADISVPELLEQTEYTSRLAHLASIQFFIHGLILKIPDQPPQRPVDTQSYLATLSELKCLLSTNERTIRDTSTVINDAALGS